MTESHLTDTTDNAVSEAGVEGSATTGGGPEVVEWPGNLFGVGPDGLALSSRPEMAAPRLRRSLFRA